MTSNSHGPYPYQERVEGGYLITSDTREEYVVYFADADGYFGDSELGEYAQMFGFFPVDPYTPFERIHDPRIADTLAQIVADFFQDRTRIAVYVCDTSLSRQRARHILFRKWYRHYNTNGSIVMQTIANGPNTYACLLYHRSNPMIDKIQEEIPEFIKKIEPFI